MPPPYPPAGGTATVIHIGQAVMALGGTIDRLRNMIFNYPKMTKACQVAAFNGLNMLNFDFVQDGVDEKIPEVIEEALLAQSSERQSDAL